jgi:hypothetical protein
MACVYFCYKLYVTVVKIHCTENKSKTFSILIDIVNSINTPRNQYYYWKSPYLKIEKKMWLKKNISFVPLQMINMQISWIRINQLKYFKWHICGSLHSHSMPGPESWVTQSCLSQYMPSLPFDLVSFYLLVIYKT